MGNKQSNSSKHRITSGSPSFSAQSPKIGNEFSEIKLEDHCDGQNIESCSAILRLSAILEKYDIWVKTNETKRKETEDQYGSIVVYDNHKPNKTSKREKKGKKKKSKVDKNGIYCMVNTKNYSNSLLLQDYQHMVTIHGNDSYDKLHEYFVNILKDKHDESDCDPRTCINLQRNNRDRRQIGLDDDIRSRLYFGYKESYEVNTQQILDQVHSYIYHCYQLGYKIDKKEIEIIPSSPESVSCPDSKSMSTSMIFHSKEKSVYDDYGENELIDPNDSTEQIRRLSQLIAKKRETLIQIRGSVTEGIANQKFITKVEHHPHSSKSLAMDSIEKIVGSNISTIASVSDEDDHNDDNDGQNETETKSQNNYQQISRENTRTIAEDTLHEPQPKEEKEEREEKEEKEQIDLNSYDKITINNNSSSVYNDNSRRRRSITQLTFNINNINEQQIDEPTDLIYNFGKRYYYWPYYRGNEWFLNPKYISFKQELVHKISIIQYQDLQTKAYDHHHTNKFKSSIAGRGWWTKEYDINAQDTISQSHILAILVYCNFDVCK